MRWSWQAIGGVRGFGRSPTARRCTRAFGVVAVSGWRVVVACYAAIVIWLMVPIALTLAAFSFSFRMIHPGS